MNTFTMSWQELAENAYFKHLARDESKNIQIDIIKLNPNAIFDPHGHPEVEWIYVLKGSYSEETGTYKAGDFVVKEKGSIHTISSGPEGCEMLCFWCGKIDSK